MMMLVIIGLIFTSAAASDTNSREPSINLVQGSDLLSHAGTFDGCMVERYNQKKPASETKLNCTASDLGIAAFNLVSGPNSCIEGEDITVTLKGQFLATASERYDIGLFVSTDGGDPNSLGGTCYNDYLHPISANNSDLNLTSGLGPFYNGELTQDPGDTCGDSQQGLDVFFTTAQITIKCQDSNDNGIADVNSCTVWSNSTSDGSDNKPSCTSELDTTAETKSKCACGNVEIAGLTVPQNGTIEVIKHIDPVDAPGAFNLQIDGVVEFANAGNGDSTGPVIVSAGFSTDDEPIGDTHTVGETAGNETDLGLYEPVINCQDQENDVASLQGAGPLEVFVEPGDAWVCTITNTYQIIETEPPVTTEPPPTTEVPATTQPPATTAPPATTEAPATTQPPATTAPPATTQPPTTTVPADTPTPTRKPRTPTPVPTLGQPTSPANTPQVLIPQTGLDLSLSGQDSGISFWLFFFLGLGLVGSGMVFYEISTQIRRRK